MTSPSTGARSRAGVVATLVVFAIYGGLALFVNPIDARRTPVDPTSPPGFQSDEATYYLMGQSLVHDYDLEYRQEDVVRTRKEFSQGPRGVFLKKGTTISGAPDSDPDRLFYGKSFTYPLFAAPFVAIFGTKGFYVFNAALLAVAFLCAYMFLSARAPVAASLILAGGFIFPTVVPVYWSWIAPELFNCVLGLVAYFCWLYKFVAPPSSSRWTAWLHAPSSDVVAAVIIGVLTFSKPTSALLGAPIGFWLIWKGQWWRATAVAIAFGVTAGLFFGANKVISGEMNYQGGARVTCALEKYPFESPGQGLEVCDTRETTSARTNVWFDKEMFWSNFPANLKYFVVGRYGGVVAYFFPFVFGLIEFALSGKRREPWQWLVLASIAAQALVFLITQPYTYFGGGGSVGNRYFMAGYGTALFFMPPVRSVALSMVPWLVGGLFMAKLVISPFDTSVRPGDRAFSGPLRALPVELTNYLDLPVRTEGELMYRWFGATEAHGGFQVTYLDKNSWLQEADRLSFWTRGKSRAEMLVRTVEPEHRLQLQLRAGEVPTTVEIDVEGHRTSLSLAINQFAIVQVAPPLGFPFKNVQGQVSYIWRMSITTDNGFVPSGPGSKDTRFLGVSVLPLIVR